MHARDCSYSNSTISIFLGQNAGTEPESDQKHQAIQSWEVQALRHWRPGADRACVHPREFLNLPLHGPRTIQLLHPRLTANPTAKLIYLFKTCNCEYFFYEVNTIIPMKCTCLAAPEAAFQMSWHQDTEWSPPRCPPMGNRSTNTSMRNFLPLFNKKMQAIRQLLVLRVQEQVKLPCKCYLGHSS